MSTEIAHPWRSYPSSAEGVQGETSRGAVVVRDAVRYFPGMGQVLPRKQARELAIVGPPRRAVLLAVSVCLFGLIVPAEIAYLNEIWVSRKVLGIPIHLAITLVVVLCALLCDVRYLMGLLVRPSVLGYLACLLMVVAVGLARNSSNLYVVFADLYTIRWFFVGFVMMRVAIVSGSLREYLLFATVIILITALGIDSRNTRGQSLDTGTVRVASIDLWPVVNLGTITLGLLVTVTWPHGVSHVAVCSAAFVLLILVGGIRSSTRSLFLFQTLCVLLCLFALSRDPRMARRGQSLRRAAVAMALLGAVLAAYMVATGKILGEVTQLGARFAIESGSRHDTLDARFREAAEMLAGLAYDEWLTGLGAGGLFYSSLKYWASYPHIAVLGWLQKGGVVILCVALWSLYIRPAIDFFMATMSPRQGMPLPHPILVVGPSLLAWCVLTFMSGGLDIGSALGLGGLSAVWMQLADDWRRAARERPPTVIHARA